MKADRLQNLLGGDVDIFRRGADAVLIWHPASAMAVLPLSWLEDVEDFELPASKVAGVLALDAAPRQTAGGIAVADLLWWASRRRPLTAWADGDEGVMATARTADAQPALGAVIDRALVREALQPLVELWPAPWPGDTEIVVERRLHGGGPLFVLHAAPCALYVMGMQDRDGTLTVGDDPMPVRT